MSEPSPVFQDLAERVIYSLPLDGTPDVGQLAKVLEDVSKRCKESFVRRSFVISDLRPNGPIAWLLRREIRKVLPDQLKTPDVELAVIKVGAWAANNDDVWNLIYPKDA